ncbi:uncharacterized protein LOC122050524 [Zingiber officinale]|uniref:uncharacterized protein LOC122050524 n=1 Tax=Zingiber officinale TaxID=94328 RepID=UPI001C4D0DC0|nr:uncharacterized protein LOC122050524 [Zingiber officinale]
MWALRTTPKEAIDVTPFQLVYNGEAVVPVEVGVESDRVHLYDEENDERRRMELDLVDEHMKQSYNRRVILRSFQVGDLVWKRIKPVDDINKLEAPWVEPYKVVQKLCSRAYYLEDENGRTNINKSTSITES